MNIGIFLSPGESFTQMKKSGQDTRFISSYLNNYAQNFEKIYIFTYETEKIKLPANVFLICNTTGLHRLIYALLLPLIHKSEINRCDVIRGFGLASSISAIFLNLPFISKKTPFIFNWAYDYLSFVRLQKKYIYLPLYSLLEKIAFIKAKRVLIATKAKLNSLSSSKFVYLPNGVDLNLFKPASRGNKGLIFIGRFEKQKNLEFLISTLYLLPKHLRKITLIGSGSQEAELKKYAGEKKVNITIRSPVPNEKLPDLFRDHSILLLPSHQEGSPKVVLESMASGLVPILTNFPTAREVISDGIDGFITDFKEKEFADKINLLFSDEKLYKIMSENATDKIRKEFNQDLLIKKEISILKNA